MNPRIWTIVAGLIIFALGVLGLVYPERVLGLLGLAYASPSHMAAALGEIRATYGGIFIVMGVYTLLAATDPALHRARLFGVYVDGNPGLPGWGAVVFELAVGGALVAVAQSGQAVTPSPALERAVRDAEARYEPPPPVAPPA